ncbi:hypothetical protein [Rhodococcus sp. NPDC049939]|uniref:hypothetical protein n=1 Tax=Rhodococcus sp. NPDC049939 TaxID=3155511 RepID=UPI0033EEDE1C
MKNLVRTISAAASIAAGTAGLTVAPAPTAQAVAISGPEAKYVFCSRNQHGNDLLWYDYFGQQERLNVTLPSYVDGQGYCGVMTGVLDYNPGYDNHVFARIKNNNSPYLYAAIYSVHPQSVFASTGGPVQAEYLRAEDRSYGGGYNSLIVG